MCNDSVIYRKPAISYTNLQSIFRELLLDVKYQLFYAAVDARSYVIVACSLSESPEEKINFYIIFSNCYKLNYKLNYEITM